MERHNVDMSRGSGRGRPMENNLRQPLNTYAGDGDYVSAEGSNNGIILGMNDVSRHDMPANGDHPLYNNMLPSGDHVLPVHQHSTPNRGIPEKKFELSPYAQEFIPRNFQPEPQVISPRMNTDLDNSYPIHELRNFLCEITLNPGMFESKVQSLADCFLDHIKSDDELRCAVNILFDESVRQPNFRYNGARLASILCSQLTDPIEEYNFTQLLINRIQQELGRRERLPMAEEGEQYLRGFAMYLAELLTQIEIPKKIPLFGDSLIAVLGTLRDHYSSNDNLKCICQILKLVGSYMDDAERNKAANNQSPMEIKKLIDLLKVVSESEDYPRDVKAMAGNVVQLRQNDWGRSLDNDPVVVDDTQPIALDEPVMYGPDGKPITAEESHFLHTQYSFHASDAEDFDEYDDAADVLEDEIEAAYEVFLNELSH